MEATYPRSIFPNVWNKCAKLITQRRLGAPDIVFTELKDLDTQDAELVASWADMHKNILFYPITNAIIRQTQKIEKQFPRLAPHRSDSEKADPYVVAMAREWEINQTLDNRKIVVVTQETVFRPTEKNRKIPGVCEFYKLKCIKLLDMIKQEEWVFHQ